MQLQIGLFRMINIMFPSGLDFLAIPLWGTETFLNSEFLSNIIHCVCSFQHLDQTSALLREQDKRNWELKLLAVPWRQSLWPRSFLSSDSICLRPDDNWPAYRRRKPQAHHSSWQRLPPFFQMAVFLLLFLEVRNSSSHMILEWQLYTGFCTVLGSFLSFFRFYSRSAYV